MGEKDEGLQLGIFHILYMNYPIFWYFPSWETLLLSIFYSLGSQFLSWPLTNTALTLITCYRRGRRLCTFKRASGFFPGSFVHLSQESSEYSHMFLSWRFRSIWNRTYWSPICKTLGAWIEEPNLLNPVTAGKSCLQREECKWFKVQTNDQDLKIYKAWKNRENFKAQGQGKPW